MLKFIGINNVRYNKYNISKHLMLKFIGVVQLYSDPDCKISKHLMLKFILNGILAAYYGNLFQNISC